MLLFHNFLFSFEFVFWLFEVIGYLMVFIVHVLGTVVLLVLDCAVLDAVVCEVKNVVFVLFTTLSLRCDIIELCGSVRAPQLLVLLLFINI